MSKLSREKRQAKKLSSAQSKLDAWDGSKESAPKLTGGEWRVFNKHLAQQDAELKAQQKIHADKQLAEYKTLMDTNKASDPEVVKHSFSSDPTSKENVEKYGISDDELAKGGYKETSAGSGIHHKFDDDGYYQNKAILTGDAAEKTLAARQNAANKRIAKTVDQTNTGQLDSDGAGGGAGGGSAALNAAENQQNVEDQENIVIPTGTEDGASTLNQLEAQSSQTDAPTNIEGDPGGSSEGPDFEHPPIDDSDNTSTKLDDNTTATDTEDSLDAGKSDKKKKKVFAPKSAGNIASTKGSVVSAGGKSTSSVTPYQSRQLGSKDWGLA